MKRNLILLLAVLMLVVAPAMLLRAEAATIVDSGTCGENLTWTLDSEGTLTISGSGAMTDYSSSSDTPWDSQRESILSVVLEEGVTSIGDMAFCACASLSNITIPDSVTTIGDGALANCPSLSSITIPEGVTAIGSAAFHYCTSLSNITIPGSVTSIGDYAFWDCTSLSSITIPEGVPTIGYMAFSGCASLTSVTIPDSVTRIGVAAFSSCDNLSSITIPESVTTIDRGAFYSCDSLSSITIPEGVTAIGSSAFSSCYNLSSITIPDSVTYIGEYAFAGCSSLSSITIPESVTTIDKGAFSSCDSLAVVHYGGTEAQRAGISIFESNAALFNATWHYGCSGANCIEQKSPFGDVAADAYYFAPVLWAVNKGITNGLSADTFGPEATCTRGQIVTFLWRANGSPEPKMVFNPFSDVSSEDYFYDAVLWAVENGITGGMGDGTFAPGAPCTRGQVATFLWRAEGQPYSYGENIFSDISYDAYYYDAVLWAVENGITKGMGEGIFAPDDTCTRGQIVTFLYRAM